MSPPDGNFNWFLAVIRFICAPLIISSGLLCITYICTSTPQLIYPDTFDPRLQFVFVFFVSQKMCVATFETHPTLGAHNTLGVGDFT